MAIDIVTRSNEMENLRVFKNEGKPVFSAAYFITFDEKVTMSYDNVSITSNKAISHRKITAYCVGDKMHRYILCILYRKEG